MPPITGTFPFVASFGKLSVTQQVTFISNYGVSPTKNVPPPFDPNSGYVCDTNIALSSNGGVYLNKLFPFAPFQANSPIRPLCVSNVKLYGNNPVAIGDVIVTAAASVSVSISASVAIKGELSVPAGFIPITFTGFSTSNGTISWAMQINISDATVPLTITTPPVLYTSVDLLSKDTSTISVLQYDIGTGATTFVGAMSFNDNPANPFTITFYATSSGIYLFGFFDPSKVSVIPATFGSVLQYKGAWQNKLISYGSNLLVNITASSDTIVDVKPIQGVTTNKITVLNQYYVSLSSGSTPTVSLISNVPSGYVWAKNIPSTTNAVGTWLSVNSYVNSDGTTSATVSGSGSYGIVNADAILSYARKYEFNTNPYFYFIILSLNLIYLI